VANRGQVPGKDWHLAYLSGSPKFGLNG